MPIGAAVLGSSVLGAVSANKAAKQGAAAANSELELNKSIYADTTENLSPYLQGGTNALNALMYELGLGPAPTLGSTPTNYSIEEIQGQGTLQPIKDTGDGVEMVYGPSTFKVGDQSFDTRDAAQAWIDAQPQSTGGQTYQGISLSPASNFLLQQGRDTIEAGAASRGGLYSGATMQELEQYRQDIALQDRETQLNRLMGLGQMGQSAAAGQGAAGLSYAQNAGNALSNAANARMAGTIGVSNSINSGANNYLGYQLFNKLVA